MPDAPITVKGAAFHRRMSEQFFPAPDSLRAQLAAPRVITPEILASTLAAQPRATVKDLITIVDQVPQLEIPVTHTFVWQKEEYWREITMPAGMTGVGHIHRHRHLNIAMTGRALVTFDGQTTEVVAPAIFWSEAGAQKAFQVFEDFRFITIHDNPGNRTDIRAIEERIFELSEDHIESGLTVDEYRMTKRNSLICRDL